MLMEMLNCDHITAQSALAKNSWNTEAAIQAYLDNPN